MRKIVKFEPWSVMKIAGICYAFMGLLEGIVFAVWFATVPFTQKNGGDIPRMSPLLFGVLMIVFFPILLGGIGAIMAGIGTAIYNLSARWVGGIEVEVS